MRKKLTITFSGKNITRVTEVLRSNRTKHGPFNKSWSEYSFWAYEDDPAVTYLLLNELAVIEIRGYRQIHQWENEVGNNTV